MTPELFQKIMHKVCGGLVACPPPAGKEISTLCWVPAHLMGPAGPINEYSMVKVNTAAYNRHVLMMALQAGEIPIAEYVLHICDLKCCCNPCHLRLGSPSNNSKEAWTRKLTKAATNQPKGEKSGRAEKSNEHMAHVKWCLENESLWFSNKDFGKRSALQVISIYYNTPIPSLRSMRRGTNWTSILPIKPPRLPHPEDIPLDATPPSPDMTRLKQRAEAVLREWHATENKRGLVERMAKGHGTTGNTIRATLTGKYFPDVCPEIPRVIFTGITEVNVATAKIIKATFAYYQGRFPVAAIRSALAQALNLPMARVVAVLSGMLHDSVIATPDDAIKLSLLE